MDKMNLIALKKGMTIGGKPLAVNEPFTTNRRLGLALIAAGKAKDGTPDGTAEAKASKAPAPKDK